MNCQQALKHIDGFHGRSLPGHEALELQDHLDTCAACRDEFRLEAELRAALRSLPVPPPSPDFVKRSFAVARERHKKQHVKQAMPFWGGALAACLALLLLVSGPLMDTAPPEQPAHQAITIKVNEQRLVKVVVDAPRDMLQADIIIELPPQIEMAGFPGLREIRWNTNLRKGKNLLSLPLIAKSEGLAKLTTHINHENKSKILSLAMQVSHDELTKMEHHTPTPA